MRARVVFSPTCRASTTNTPDKLRVPALTWFSELSRDESIFSVISPVIFSATSSVIFPATSSEVLTAASSLGMRIDRFETGKDSPVNIDSSIVLCPTKTRPSTGKVSPGNTRTHSPTRSRSLGTSMTGQWRRLSACSLERETVARSRVDTIKRAWEGRKFKSWRRAEPARYRACSSKVRPKRINPSNMTGSSKKQSHCS